MRANTSKSCLIAVALTLAGFSPAVFAYLDPSTGSMILSAIVGMFATAGLAVKTYWYKLKGFFRGGNQASADALQEAHRQDDEQDSA